MVFADVAAALVDNRGFAEVHAAPSTPWDHPGYFETGFGSNTDALLASMALEFENGTAAELTPEFDGAATFNYAAQAGPSTARCRLLVKAADPLARRVQVQGADVDEARAALPRSWDVCKPPPQTQRIHSVC